uniref:hypothetical protein n=1 Tax=Streptomyces sp. SAT1 TaxID=1849967 RepID=UPI0019D084B3|nr:hypothetical protein [Streptomyces sp. SAT1]
MAVVFHPETGQIDLRPDFPAYAAQLRLITTRITATANTTVGTDAMRTVRAWPRVPCPRQGPRQRPRLLRALRRRR